VEVWLASQRLLIEVPDWVPRIAAPGIYRTDQDRMGLVVALARENVVSRTGGPFGSAVFERSTGRLIAGGVNLVLPMRNSVLHAEVVAIMLAEAQLQSFTLGIESGAEHELVTSCEPCAMCLGAVHWSGVTRLVTGATKEDVEGIRFDEGPVFRESYRYLEERGVAVEREVLRAEASAVLRLYATMSGEIY
jgi:tRNA(Arg) A34 adenosine deaminase TadA